MSSRGRPNGSPSGAQWVTSPGLPRYVGPRNKKASDENNGQASACAEPTNPGGSGRADNEGEDGRFWCEFPGCDRFFMSKTGRGLHHKKGHPDWNDRRVLAGKQHQKETWSEEERLLLAKKEAELVLSGARFINMELREVTARSLDAIKGQRKRPDYKILVEKLVGELRSGDVRQGVPTQSQRTRARVVAVAPAAAPSRVPPTTSQPPPSGRVLRSRGVEAPIEVPAVESGTESSEDELFEDAEPVRPSLLPPDMFTLYFAGLEIPESEDAYAHRLHTICLMTTWRSKEEVRLELGLFLKDLFPNKSNKERSEKRSNPPVPRNRVEKRRAEYKRCQDLWRRNKSTCVQRILKEDLSQGECLPRELMEPFWNATFTQNPGTAPVLPPPTEVYSSVWDPIQPQNIKGNYPPHNTAAGVDGVTVGDLKGVSREMLARIFNLFMWCGKLPEHLCASRTILLPKKPGAKAPGEFRPITVTSVLIRTFHKVLAERLKVVPLDPRQRGFRESDGCAENVMLLDMTIRYHHERRRKMSLALLDMAKAFDSVSFESMREVLTTKGIPAPFIDYFMTHLEDSFTVLQHGDWQSGRIHPTCGVKQGDPLSPPVFNFIMDEMLKRLPEEIGVNLDGLFVNAMAFADDLSLVANTEQGLQILINEATSFLGLCGLRANPNKCVTLAIKTIPKEKKTAIDPSTRFKIGNAMIPSLKRTDEWVYLGIKFNANGRLISDAKPKLVKDLELLTKAPLKPQQRLWALKVIVIPGILYRGTLGNSTAGYLRSLDCVIRAYVRRWLRLPGDCPNGYFHAAVADGGLGIHPIRYKAMVDRLARLQKLEKSAYITGPEAARYLQRQISIAENRLRDGANRIMSNADLLRGFLRELLYKSFDGRPLETSSKVPGQHRWVEEPTRFLSGADYMNCIRARIAALPTAARCARGRLKEKQCRAGCGNVETLNHVLQFCHRTHGTRIGRHDAVVKYVKGGLVKRGWAVTEEPKIVIQDTVCKPDLVATKEGRALVLDAQVLGDQREMRLAHEDKIRKYGAPAIKDKIRNDTGSTIVKALSVTLNWRGLWSPDSVKGLLEEGVILKRDLKIVSTRVLIGALAGWRRFNERTSMATTGRREEVTTRNVRRWKRRERVGVG